MRNQHADQALSGSAPPQPHGVETVELPSYANPIAQPDRDRHLDALRQVHTTTSDAARWWCA